MKTIFSTEEVASRDRFSYWHEVACARIIEHVSRPDCPERFEARIQAASIADIELAMIENSPMSYEYTRSHVAGDDSGKVLVLQQMAGQMMIEQDGRTAVLNPGHIALFDPQRPWFGRFLGESRLQVTKVPRSGLEARLGSLRMASATIVNSDEREEDFIFSFLAMLPRYAGGLHTGVEDIVQDQVVELLAASFAKALDQPCSGGSVTVTLTRLRVRAAIEAMLSEPDLSVQDVAARAGVSVRYANQALSSEQTSIMRLVLARRLERCRQSFEDPLQDRRSISAIAYGWGFSDMTHFARRFAQAYGVLPRDFRQMARMYRLKDRVLEGA